MTWSAQKMIMFCIFRDVRACKGAKKLGGTVLFLDKQKIFRKIIFWFHFSLSTPSLPIYPHLSLGHIVPEGNEKGLKLDGWRVARQKLPREHGQDILVTYRGQWVTT